MRFSPVMVLWGFVRRAGFVDGITTPVDGDCASADDDPDYDFELPLLDSFKLFWRVANSSVSVKAVYQGEGWLGVGFSDSGSMPGSDAVVGLPDDNTALEYDMPNYAAPLEAEEQEISAATITQADGVTTLTFVRPLEPTGEGKQVLSTSGSVAWLYAWGRTNEFVEHIFQRSVSFSLDACATGNDATFDDANDDDANGEDANGDAANDLVTGGAVAIGAPFHLSRLVILGTSLWFCPLTAFRAQVPTGFS